MSLFFCLFLVGPFALFAGQRGLNVDAPTWLTSEPAAFLAGGLPTADVASHANLRGFADKQLQSAAETKIGNFIPAKAFAIEMNADWQRASAALSSSLFSWDCYPTYYGSRRIALQNEDAVSYLPSRDSSGMRDRWTKFAEGVSRVADRFPEKRFVVYVVPGYNEPGFNPAYDLVTNPLRPEVCAAIMEQVLSKHQNVTVLSQSFENGQEYYQEFFRTDHHWNINGAFAAYSQIASRLGLPRIDEEAPREVPDYWFTGATARWGVDLIRERVFDCGSNFSQLSVTLSDGTKTNGDDHDSFWNVSPLRKPYAFYDCYYDNFGDCTIEGGVGERSALLVGNSYKGALQRPLAMSYKQLTVNGQLHPSSPVDSTLSEQIQAASADDIVFVANPSCLSIEDSYWE